MKAEHRKELQTNTLADFLGRTVRNVRTSRGPSWTMIGVFLLLAIVLVVGWVVYKNWGLAAAEDWERLQFNDFRSLGELETQSGSSPQGQAARFTLGFNYLTRCVALMGVADGKVLEEQLQKVRGYFAQLAEECKDDPIRSAEAKYHIATATEALAAFNPKHLIDAKVAFEDAAKGDLADTPHGVMAKKRLERYNSDFAGIEKFYREFRAGSKFGG